LNVAQVLAQLGGGKIALTLPATSDIPATVNTHMGKYPPFPLQLVSEADLDDTVEAVDILNQDKELGKAIYGEFLPEALKNGQIKPAPKAEIVGHGIEHVQTAVDKLKAGVSGTKLVVTL